MDCFSFLDRSGRLSAIFARSCAIEKNILAVDGENSLSVCRVICPDCLPTAVWRFVASCAIADCHNSDRDANATSVLLFIGDAIVYLHNKREGQGRHAPVLRFYFYVLYIFRANILLALGIICSCRVFTARIGLFGMLIENVRYWQG